MNVMKSHLRYAFYILFHPFDGFYDLKHEKRGSMRVALILYALTGFSALLRQQFSDYLFNPQADAPQNVFLVLLIAIGPYLLWCLSNWCFSSLMDGEGSMTDMVKATGYALTPLFFTNLICMILSLVLLRQEGHYLLLIDGIGLIWAVLWTFLAMMITQQYSFGKSVATAVLTVVGMALILFVLLLLFYLVQQVYTFVLDLIAEARFRFST